MTKPKVVFFGSGAFSLTPLKTLKESGASEIILVVTKPPKPSGRGRRLKKNPVHELAEKMGLGVLHPERVEEALDVLRALEPDLFVVVSFGAILKKETLEIPRMGSINLHPSLLPELRGPAPINRAITKGLERTGVTTILMDEGVDTGPILLQSEVKIDRSWDSLKLFNVLQEEGSKLLVKTIEGWVSGSIEPKPQAGEPSYAPPLRKEEGLIDWKESSWIIERKVKGLKPWPMAYTNLRGRRIIITEAEGVEGEDKEGGLPGTIVELGKTIKVQTGDGILEIKKLKPEGKREMTSKEFTAGRNIDVGERFGN